MSPAILEVRAPDAWRQLRAIGKEIGVAILDKHKDEGHKFGHRSKALDR